MGKTAKKLPEKISELVKKQVIVIFSCIAIFNALLFGWQAFQSGETLLLAFDIIILVISLGLGIWTALSKEIKCQQIACILVNMIFFLYLYASGGYDHTGYLWSILVPISVYYLSGIRKGTYFTLIYLIACLIISLINLAYPGILQLPSYSVLIRCTIIYIMASVILVAYEYSHIRNQQILRNEIEKRIIAQDEAHKVKLDLELASSNEKYQLLFNNIQEGFALHEIIVDSDGKPVNYRFLDVNQAFERLTMTKREDIIGKLGNEILPSLDNSYIQEFGRVALTGASHHYEYYVQEIEKHFSVNVVSPEAGKFATVLFDITDLKKKEQDILYLSYRDVLTGLYNRRYFEEAMRKMDKADELPFSIIMGDLNGLKLINDVFGHFEGDRLLCKTARLMENFCSQKDILARWGGDEFIVLLPRTSEKEAESICKVIKRECEALLVDEPLSPSISLGYATKEKSDQDLVQTLKTAEDYMYRRKLLESTSLRSAVVNSIKNTLYEKSHETEEHAERLKQFCKSIGTHMNLSDIEQNELELFSVLHDIGKIAIKDSILNKPGKLTDEEWREMKRHPEIGYRIAVSSPELSHIADYILTHHERWDGNGYPQGFKGEEIPLLSRIVALADSFDAMVSDRPYRKALSEEVAVSEIIKNAGSQFDPHIARIFVEKTLGRKWDNT